MANQIRIVFTTILILISAPLTAVADESCRAHYTFDGNLSDTGGNGYNGTMIDAEGPGPKPNFHEGKYGQALVFDGTSAMTAPIDLNYDTCPFVTFTAWIQAAEGRSNQTEYLISTGLHSTPGVFIGDKAITLQGAWGIRQDGIARAAAGWTFIAGVYDHVANTFRLHWGSRNESATLGILDEPKTALWIGAINDELHWALSGVAVDDLRIYDKAFTVEEIEVIRKTASPTPGSGGFVPSEYGAWAGRSCLDHPECGLGAYCGFDNTCHPDSHAPKRALELTVLDQPIELIPLDELSADDPPQTGGDLAGPQPTGERIIGNIIGSFGNEESVFEVSRGFLRRVGLGVYDSCAVRLNDEYFSFCSLDSRSLHLDASLPTAHVGAIRGCNGPNGVLRGLEIRGGAQRADGSYWAQIDESSIGQPARLTCGREDAPQYGTLQLCGANQLATGLVVHIDGNRNPVGLQMICRRVE